MLVLLSARDPWGDLSSQIVIFLILQATAAVYCNGVCNCRTMRDSFPHHKPLSYLHPHPFPIPTLNLSPPMPPPHLSVTATKLPVGHLNGLFVGWGDQEADRRHHGLIPCGADHLPLGPLGIVLQDTLVIPADGDLQQQQHQQPIRIQQQGPARLSLLPAPLLR